MKILITAVALAAMAASPAFARTHVRHHAAPVYAQPEAGYAAPQAYNRGEVFQGNEYIGSDPDARVRLEMQRDTDINAGG
jgi:hypothetical protein